MLILMNLYWAATSIKHHMLLPLANLQWFNQWSENYSQNLLNVGEPFYHTLILLP